MVIFCQTVGKIENFRLSHTQKIAANKLIRTEEYMEDIEIVFKITHL